eukprot:11221231-Lingulodinium_polyedra.AAC.1
MAHSAEHDEAVRGSAGPLAEGVPLGPSFRCATARGYDILAFAWNESRYAAVPLAQQRGGVLLALPLAA